MASLTAATSKISIWTYSLTRPSTLNLKVVEAQAVDPQIFESETFVSLNSYLP